MKAILLLNLGTPDSPEPKAVGRYLREFLMDKWVLDIPFFNRWLLVNLLIVPRRKFASSRAYKEVWTERGSPLSFYLDELQAKIQELVGRDVIVEKAMRYGNPSIAHALRRLQAAGATELKIFQLYPQYAESTVRSSEEKIKLELERLNYKPAITFVPPYYDQAEFIKPYAELLRTSWQEHEPDHLLLSFHGLPERHVKKTDLTGMHCLKTSDCCASIVEANKNCYRAQCFATARAIARELGLTADKYTVSFQSRLGRTPWIKPYTDEIYPQLAKTGKKRLLVACPSFATDCLETLEEVAIRGRSDFFAAGGTWFELSPCLNSERSWAEGVIALVKNQELARQLPGAR